MCIVAHHLFCLPSLYGPADTSARHAARRNATVFILFGQCLYLLVALLGMIIMLISASFIVDRLEGRMDGQMGLFVL